VTYRGERTCKSYTGRARVELHSVWDDCLVEELAHGRDAKTLARDILGGITSYGARPEVANAGDQPWLAWGNESHALAVSVAFDSLQEGADLEDAYITGPNKALDTLQKQLL